MASFAAIECLHIQVRVVLCLVRVVQRLAFMSLHGSLDCTLAPLNSAVWATTCGRCRILQGFSHIPIATLEE